MEYKIYQLTYEGNVLQNNEDNYYLNGLYKTDTGRNRDANDLVAKDHALLGVFDGMGGIENGEIASFIAAKAMKDYQEGFIEKYQEYVEAANQKICDEISHRGEGSMGCTFCCAELDGDKMKCFNIGDSRIYHWHDKELKQISQDHTEADRLVSIGAMSKEEARNSKYGHVLTQHLGIDPEEMMIEPFASDDISLNAGDCILLCSDGLTDMVSDERISERLMENVTAEEKIWNLLRDALDSGGKDNITIILAFCE